MNKKHFLFIRFVYLRQLDTYKLVVVSIVTIMTCKEQKSIDIFDFLKSNERFSSLPQVNIAIIVMI